jgi:enterochelin esterase-like enzyme
MRGRSVFPFALLGSALLAIPGLHAQSRPGTERQRARADVEFKLVQSVASTQQAVFLLGDLPELGDSDTTRAVQLVSSDRKAWRVVISLPLDRDYTYAYMLRSTRIDDLGNPGNGTPISALLSGRTPSTVRGPGTKSMQVHTALVGPQLHWRQGQGEYATEILEVLGPGRTSSELRCGVRAFGLGERPVEFFLTSSDGSARDPANSSKTYVTPLDRYFLQDGELFTYVPAAHVTPMHRAYSTPFHVVSSVLGQERTYRVMLPRGYVEHTGKRYPVLYQYDGKNMWDEALRGFGIWDRDGGRMAGLVARGEAGELIQVAIDYIDDPSCVDINRGRDCLSPEDRVEVDPCGDVRGMADRFVRFVATELKPRIDATYRTLPDREHTFATGYSFGGVFALYSGWEFTQTFGAIAAQSGSFWVPNFPARVMTELRPDLRIYLDTGDLEDPISLPNLRLRNDSLLRQGRVLERDLRFGIGYGQNHAYTNGGRRMRGMLTFLWPATREVSALRW